MERVVAVTNDQLLRKLRDEPPELRLPGRNSTKADILVYSVAGRRIAIKDYGDRPWLLRATLGRFQTARECRAYLALEGVDGLPAYLGRPGPYCLALAWVEGRPLAEYPPGSISPGVFDRLDAILAAVHSRCVALVDLHHRDVLLDEAGGVHVLDLAAARVGRRTSGSGPGRWIQRLQRLDRLQAIRLRARFTGADVEAAMEQADPGLARWHRRGRNIKRGWDRLRHRR